MDPLVAANVVAGGDDTAREAAMDYMSADIDPYGAAGLMKVDEIIDPADTRPTLSRALNRLSNRPVADGSHAPAGGMAYMLIGARGDRRTAAELRPTTIGTPSVAEAAVWPRTRPVALPRRASPRVARERRPPNGGSVTTDDHRYTKRRRGGSVAADTTGGAGARLV